MHVRARAASRCAAIGALATALVAVTALPALAHVEIEPGSATKGAEHAILDLTVPNERDDASTTELSVQIPEEAKFESVRAKTMAGWTISFEKDGDAVTTITWSGGEIKPGEFDEFTISVGPIPKKGTHLHFPTLQTYSDGEVVRWIEEAEEGAPEPENPAPELELTKASTKSGGESGHHD